MPPSLDASLDPLLTGALLDPLSFLDASVLVPDASVLAPDTSVLVPDTSVLALDRSVADPSLAFWALTVVD